ncbi:MAG TPA: hypothetical protein VJC18_04895, partial [bacterium]|nr:hypothetical protein [bacterium]
MPITRTQTEIDALKSTTQALDTNKDGQVDKPEYYQGHHDIEPAITNFARGEFHIVTFDDYKYWTQSYSAGTPAKFWVTKKTDVFATDDGFDMQAEIRSAYDDGQILDMALAIENDPRHDEAMVKLAKLEQDWLAYETDSKQKREKYTDTQLITRICSKCPRDLWQKANLDPRQYFTSLGLSHDQLQTLNVLVDLINFIQTEKGTQYVPDASTTDLL